VRVEIPGVRWGSRPGLHAYLYFPTRTPWTPWEIHPFSVMPTMLLNCVGHHHDNAVASEVSSRDASGAMESTADAEKYPATATSSLAISSLDRGSSRISLFVRRGSCTTNISSSHENLLTLVEGPYKNTSSEEVLQCDRLLLFAGGIGITALVPHMAAHSNFRLCWSLKDEAKCLIDEFQTVSDKINEKQIRVGERHELLHTISQEVARGWKKLGIMVAGRRPCAMMLALQ